ncbi:hypothetical protein [Echinicola soli]|uniref:hypothetical protein n=1 Tax=Echinicola soli TaxID=2591634 RepID=UPI00143D8584|nr:hypothetical protein [Echinicola soli]
MTLEYKTCINVSALQVLGVKKLNKRVGKKAGLFDEMLLERVIGSLTGGVCLHDGGV